MILLIVTVIVGSSYHNYFEKIDYNTEENFKLRNKSEISSVDTKYLSEKSIDPFITHLPVLMIDTNGQVIEKETDTWGKIGIYYNLQGENNIMDSPDVVINCTVNLRGASSYSGFDKNQYRITLYNKKKGKNYEYPLAGMGRNSQWILHGPFLDKTLIRNALCYDLGREMFSWAPDNRYVEVFRDGKYEGVYLLVEPVSNGESRLRLCEFGLLSGETAYILKRDRSGTEENKILTWGIVNGKTINEMSISYPTDKKITRIQRQWILNDIGQFEKDLYEGGKNYDNYIDVNNFADYFILNELALNNDAGKLSTYVYKDLREKLRLAVWDFNNCFDNYIWFSMDYTEFHMIDAPWFDQLIKDREFIDIINRRYYEYRKTILSTENLFKIIDRKRAYLGDAIERNYKIWGYAFQLSLLINDTEVKRDIITYEESINQLKDSIEKRLEYMDTHLKDLYLYCQ